MPALQIPEHCMYDKEATDFLLLSLNKTFQSHLISPQELHCNQGLIHILL